MDARLRGYDTVFKRVEIYQERTCKERPIVVNHESPKNLRENPRHPRQKLKQPHFPRLGNDLRAAVTRFQT